MTLVWDVRFPTQSQLLIALKLADFANDQGGSVYPSRNRLADDAQCSESTVKNVLRLFRDIGLLHVVEEGGKGPRDTTKYALNTKLLTALSHGDCTMVDGDDGVEIKWVNKGAEFDPLGDLRGQPEPLRGQPDAKKGSTALPPIHQEPSLIDTSGACVRASDKGARSTPAKVELVLAGDIDWTLWIDYIERKGLRCDALIAEGAMCIFSQCPGPGVDMPKLPPLRGSARWNALSAERDSRLIEGAAGKGLTDRSKRMAGDDE